MNGVLWPLPGGYNKASPYPASQNLGWGRITAERRAAGRRPRCDRFGTGGGSPHLTTALGLQAGIWIYRRDSMAARSCRRLFCDRLQPGTGHAFQRQRRRQRLRRLHARRLLDPFRADRLVHRCNPAGNFLRHQLDRQPRPADVQDPRPGFRRLARNRISLQVRRRLVHRTAGATGLPEHQHQ